MTEVHYLTIDELGELFSSSKLSPVEATSALLERIASLDDRLASYTLVMPEAALESARRAETEIAGGRHRGPLHGVPVAVKDLCDVAGAPTLAGTTVLSENVARSNATVVERLVDAGAVILGKLNLTEGAMGGYHPNRPVPANPWGENRWAGVSSSGSGVAVAAGLCFAALGSDTGGSIRFPAAANGVVGLKPTYGRVSRHGVFPLAESLDHVGPLCRSSLDAAIVLRAIAGADPKDPTSLLDPVPDLVGGIGESIAGLRIGLDRDYATAGVDHSTVEAVDDAVSVLADAGAEVVDIEMPSIDDQWWFVLCGAQAAVAHAEFYPDQADRYGGFMRGFLEQGHQVSGMQFAEAEHHRQQFSGQLARVFSDVDVIACPSMHTGAFEAPPEKLRRSFDEVMNTTPDFGLDFTARFDLSGNPTISLPAGRDANKMPLSVQFVGRHLDEALLCRIGHVFQQATDWHHQHPNL